MPTIIPNQNRLVSAQKTIMVQWGKKFPTAVYDREIPCLVKQSTIWFSDLGFKAKQHSKPLERSTEDLMGTHIYIQ